jgi:hypothetical protein
MVTSTKQITPADAVAVVRTKVRKSQAPRPPHTTGQHVDPSTGEEQLPLYSKDGSDALSEIEQLATTLRMSDSNGLPITSYAAPIYDANFQVEENNLLRRRIVDIYYDAISKADMHMVTALLESGMVTVETTDSANMTPLLAAVKAGKIAVVRYLVNIGADVDALGVTAIYYRDPKRPRMKESRPVYQTPLQYAAELGNLAIVKLLMEKGADDSMVAPDGQIALRLAASNGHRDIVAYLPRRRGGGFKRWKVKHGTAMRRCKRAAHSLYEVGRFCVYEVPRFFVWTIPKNVLLMPIVRALKWLHEHRAEIPGMVADAMRKVWCGAKKAPGVVWQGLKKVPKFMKDLVSAIGKLLRFCLAATWKLISRIPKATKIALVWLWEGMKKTGVAVGKTVVQLVSFLHTIGAAIANFFQRITIQDIFRGLAICLHAVFIDAPKAIWQWIYTFGEASMKVCKAMFGGMSWLILELFKCIVAALVFVPRKLGEILVACGSSVRNGGKEVLVWIDPKWP